MTNDNGIPALATAPEAHAAPDTPRTAARPALERFAWLAVLLIVLVQAAVIVSAGRHNSTTFDEITLVTAGARGFGTGQWDMLPDGPPVMHYLYGFPAWLSGLEFPADSGIDVSKQRYQYAQNLFWKTGNDGDRIIAIARGVAAACAALLVILVFAYTRTTFDTPSALLAALLVAFLPDVVAHGGVAYNDIALAPAFLASLWALDRAARAPTLARGALAGCFVSISIGIKHTALILGPIGLALLVVELLGATERRARLPRLLAAVGAAIAAGYLTQVAIYRGDFTLELLRESTVIAHGSITGARNMPTYLLGVTTPRAGWSFYPVVFFFKTSAALHLLAVLALLGALVPARRTTARMLARLPLRALIIALVLYGAALLRADLTLGFRYALALLPVLCILIAAGVMALWRRSSALLRGAIAVLALWATAWTLSFYPYFLTYTSEYQPSRELGYEVFVDSNLDWGQGLVALREFMREEGIDRIYLSYFGSALPEGYGIDYVPLPSFFPLPQRPLPEDGEPPFVAVSATNLAGLYFTNDPYGVLREREPYRVLANSIFIFHMDE